MWHGKKKKEKKKEKKISDITCLNENKLLAFPV